MTLVALGSVRGAPGVSTLALLLAGGIEGTPVVEADLAGGVMSARYELGREPGLTTLAGVAGGGAPPLAGARAKRRRRVGTRWAGRSRISGLVVAVGGRPA